MVHILKLQTTALFAGLGTPYNRQGIKYGSCNYPYQLCILLFINTVWNSSCEESQQLDDYAKSLVKVVEKFGGIQLMLWRLVVRLNNL